MNKERILIVEDEADIRELIHFHLFRHKYSVIEAENGKVGLEKAISEKPDLIILDIMMPEYDGLEVCTKIREHSELDQSKIIFLSAKGEESDIVKGLELGGDDYITKPFSPNILIARVKSVLRRGASHSQDQDNLVHGISIDEDKRKVTIDSVEVNLSVTEFQILSLFIKKPGHVYTRAQIVDLIRGHNHAVTDRSVDTQIVSLRKKMKEKGKLIETVWGVGYRFKEDEA